MAINSVGQNLATAGTVDSSKAVKNKSALGKDDFMKLLLVELQHQDPTSPMDTEKILAQTSQLATLESTDKTNKALENLSKSLGNTKQFSTIAAIGKTADLGSDSITYSSKAVSKFEVYFPEAITAGTLEITDKDGNKVSTMNIKPNKAGVYRFDWNGQMSNGKQASDGIYHINASYTNANGEARTTRMGAYPIESVRFQNGKTLFKVGSSYVPLEKIKEVY